MDLVAIIKREIEEAKKIDIKKGTYVDGYIGAMKYIQHIMETATDEKE